MNILSWLLSAISLLLLALNTQCTAQQRPLPLTSPIEASSLGTKEHIFALRHVFHHGSYKYPDLHRKLDVDLNTIRQHAGDDSRKIRGRKALFFSAQSRTELVRPSIIGQNDQAENHMRGPNVRHKETILSLARMGLDAYEEKPFLGEWQDVGRKLNYSQSFGWKNDGIRGHVFADSENSTIVIAIKGTSKAVFDGAETTTNDKINDNLFFSCCCAQQGHYLWRKVCDCGLSTFTANETCLERELYRKDRYYAAALELYGNVTEIYPRSDVWVTGHSLGGVMSSLLGLKFQVPAVTFEAPPDSLPATRLRLYSPLDLNSTALPNGQYRGAYHFGNTADPVYMGTCNGATATCTLAGYAFESQCHTGFRCVYDTVEDFGWRQKIQHHSIEGVIKDVIEAYDTVPSCEPEPECVDCANWKFERSNSSQSTTTSVTSTTSTTTSLTRTSVCKTPGWWGCRDESSTTTTTDGCTLTSTITTMTCISWGWFGCNVPVQTTITTTIAHQSYPTSSSIITAAPTIS